MIEASRAPAGWSGRVTGLVAGLALAVRLLPLPLIARWLPRVNEAGFADDGSAVYLPLAHSIAERGEFGFAPNAPSCAHVPLYPLLLAGLLVLRLSGPVWLAGVQAILGATALLLLFMWVRRLAGPVPAFFAVGWAALLPDFAVYSYINLSENLGIVFILATLALFEAALRREGLGLWALAGIALGLAGLTREYSITLLVPLALAAAVRIGGLRAARRMGVMTLAAALTIMPWMVRNYRLFGEVIPLSSKGGVNVYIGTLKSTYHPSDPRQNWVIEDARQIEVARRLKQDLAGATTLSEKNRLYLHAAWRNLTDDPWGVMGQMARKVTFFWQPNIGLRHRGRVGFGPILAISEASYILCLLAAACAVFARRFVPAPLGTLGLLIGWTFLFHLVVGEGESRYHFGLLPAVFACAGMTCAWIVELFMQRRFLRPRTL